MPDGSSRTTHARVTLHYFTFGPLLIVPVPLRTRAAHGYRYRLVYFAPYVSALRYYACADLTRGLPRVLFTLP